MRAQLRADLTSALKARDRVAIAALRSALSALENAEAVVVADAGPIVDGTEHVAGASVGVGATEATRRELTAADVRAVLRDEVAQRITAADEYLGLNQADAAERLRAEAAVLSHYLAD
jgi:uncharacterized protein